MTFFDVPFSLGCACEWLVAWRVSLLGQAGRWAAALSAVLRQLRSFPKDQEGAQSASQLLFSSPFGVVSLGDAGGCSRTSTLTRTPREAPERSIACSGLALGVWQADAWMRLLCLMKARMAP